MSDSAPAKKEATHGAPEKFNGLTQRDLEILSKAWGAMKAQPEIDYQKLADACGMTNPRSASNAWSLIKKKLFINVPSAKAAGAPKGETPGKKRKTPAKKTPVEDDDAAVKDEAAADEDDIQAEATPTKKARSRAKPKAKTPAKVKDEDDSADEKEEEVKATPVKKARPAARAKANTKAKKDAAVKEPKPEEDSDDGPDGADSVPAHEAEVDGEV